MNFERLSKYIRLLQCEWYRFSISGVVRNQILMSSNKYRAVGLDSDYISMFRREILSRYSKILHIIFMQPVLAKSK